MEKAAPAALPREAPRVSEAQQHMDMWSWKPVSAAADDAAAKAALSAVATGVSPSLFSLPFQTEAKRRVEGSHYVPLLTSFTAHQKIFCF